ncbi:MAG TPA: hypothetical protein VD766_01530, partial [Solirubrobacterales bacterium]|nr:hypothetical protein [Solirubrobacterales bacterium]
STTSTTPTGATGAEGAALSEEDFILRADEICAAANNQVGSLDPTDPNATQDEFQITRDELANLDSLELAEPSQPIEKFLSDLGDVVTALKAKAKAGEDVAAADAAQLDIDTAEVAAREQGERAGFSDCGQFLDAGEGTSGGGGGGGGEAVAPADTGGVTPPTEEPAAPPIEPVTPPDDGGTVTPPPADGGGGDPGGGVTP